MSQRSVFDLMRDWGYYPWSKSHPDSLGYTGLLVVICKEPTGGRFDSQMIRLCLRDEHGLIHGAVLSMLSPLERAALVCPGIIQIQDRSNKRVEFFSFGSSVETVSRPGEMIFGFRSPAPILELTTHWGTIQDELAAKTAELLAEAEAKWGLDERTFSQQLARINPFRLYLAILHSLLCRFAHAHALEEVQHSLHQALQQEKAWLASKHQWPPKPLTVEELFAPS